MKFQKDDLAIHIPTNSKVLVIEVLPKEILNAQQVECKCVESVISEDVGSVSEYDLDSLQKIDIFPIRV